MCRQTEATCLAGSEITHAAHDVDDGGAADDQVAGQDSVVVRRAQQNPVIGLHPKLLEQPSTHLDGHVIALVRFPHRDPQREL